MSLKNERYLFIRILSQIRNIYDVNVVIILTIRGVIVILDM